MTARGGSTLGQRGMRPPDSLVAPAQIQKLADRSDVISEVPKCSKIQFSPDPAGGAIQRSPDPLANG